VTAKPRTVTDLRIVQCDNPPFVRSSYAFDYEPYSARGLKTLRSRYALDDVVKGSRTEFDEILRLRDWVSAQWDHGFDNLKQWETTGLAYLQRAHKGECFTCAVYAFTLVEVLTAMGIPARSITLAKANTDFIRRPPPWNVGHVVTEAWSNQFHKWIVLDADSCAHFGKGGIPLSALEVRNAWLQNRGKGVRFVRGRHVPRLVPDAYPGDRRQLARGHRAFLRHNTMDYYAHLEFVMTNRHYTGSRRPAYRLAWADAHAPPQIVRQNVAVDPRERIATSLCSDIYYTLNQAFIRLHCPPRRNGRPGSTLAASLETQTPWFSHFEARIDAGRWRQRRGRFPWRLRNGINAIEVRPVNKFGREGSTSRIAVRCRMG